MNIAIEDMDRHIDAGRAHPLLPEGTPGPVRHRGQWWAVPTGAEHYQPTGPQHASRLDAHAGRLARAEQAASNSWRA